MTDDKNAPQWKPVPPMEQFHSALNQRHRPLEYTDRGKAKRAPALKYEYWLKPSGNVVKLAIHSTRDIAGGGIGLQAYEGYVRRRALRSGWIPWDYKIAEDYAPKVLGQRDEKEWLAYREDERKRRIVAHNEQAREMEGAWATQMERGDKGMGQAAQALTDMTRLLERQAAQAQAPAPVKGK